MGRATRTVTSQTREELDGAELGAPSLEEHEAQFWGTMPDGGGFLTIQRLEDGSRSAHIGQLPLPVDYTDLERFLVGRGYAGPLELDLRKTDRNRKRVDNLRLRLELPTAAEVDGDPEDDPELLSSGGVLAALAQELREIRAEVRELRAAPTVAAASPMTARDWLVLLPGIAEVVRAWRTGDTGNNPVALAQLLQDNTTRALSFAETVWGNATAAAHGEPAEDALSGFLSALIPRLAGAGETLEGEPEGYALGTINPEHQEQT